MNMTHSELKARWYQQNKELTKQRVLERRESLRALIQDLKTGQACAWCSEIPEDSTELDFHHKNPSDKEIKISRIPYYGWSEERTRREIAKCVLICKRCHGTHHGQSS